MKFIWSERPWMVADDGKSLPGTGRIAEVEGVVFSIPDAYRSHVAYTLVWGEGWSVPQFIGSGRLDTYTDRQYPEIITVTAGARMSVTPGRLAAHGAEWEVVFTETGEPILQPYGIAVW